MLLNIYSYASIYSLFLDLLVSFFNTFKYAIDLRSMTQGRGYFEMELDKYEEVPLQIAQKIINEINNK